MSDFGKLLARTNQAKQEESDILLIFENPTGELLEIEWKIRFPFPVMPAEKVSGTLLLRPDKTATTSWTTAMVGLTISQQEAAWDQEIEVELQASTGDIFLQDGAGSMLRQLHGHGIHVEPLIGHRLG